MEVNVKTINGVKPKNKIGQMLKIRKASIRISLIYILISLLWIFFSDSAMKLLVKNPVIFTSLSILKGFVFVIVTGSLLYILIEGNIKELRRSEEELKKKDEIYRLVIGGTTDGLWDWNPQTNQVYISPEMKGNLGYTDGELESSFKSWRALLHPEDSERSLKLIDDYINKRIPALSGEFRLKNKKGEYIWILAKGQGIWDDEGRAIRVIGTHTEISERKHTEEKLRVINEENIRLLNETLEYDKLKTEFFINISHEFRTPLNVIFGIVQLIEAYRNVPGDQEVLFGKLQGHIGTIKKNCNRLLKLINNLIDITRIDSGFLELNLQNCNIVQVVEEVVFSVVEYVESKSISLVFDTEIEEKIISCDIDKIERSVLNLLANATKYTNPGGEIHVSIKDLKDEVQISVKDTGIGIPEDKIKVIFERFRQVNSSLTRDHEGSGIGLSLVKSFVEIHGGKIEVESKLGKGSEFKIELPAKKEVLDNAGSPAEKAKKRVCNANIEFSDIYFN